MKVSPQILDRRIQPIADAAPVSHSVVSLEELEGAMLELPQVEVPVEHYFAPGVYMREVVMPSGAFIIGHEHKTEHLNVVSSGRVRVLMDGQVHEIVAPCTFVSKPGVRKTLLILEKCRWATVHPTNEIDLKKLEEELIVKSQTFLSHQEQIEQLKLLQIAQNPEPLNPSHE